MKNVPVLEAIQDVAPDAGYRVHGLKIAREPRRYSGRTAMRAPLSVHEPKQPTDPDSALTFSMEGYVGPQKSFFACTICVGTRLELSTILEQIPR